MRFGVVFVVGLHAVFACHPMGPTNHGGGFGSGANANVQFSPNSAVRDASVTANAVRFYAGDKALLQQVGAAYIGDLDLDTSQPTIDLPFTKKPTIESLTGRAATEGGSVGATHYVLVEAGVDVKEYQVAPERTETESKSGVGRDGRTHSESVTVHKEAQAIRTTSPRGRFALFRVDPSRWAELPTALRPVPISGESSSTTTTSAPAPQEPANTTPTPAKRDMQL